MATSSIEAPILVVAALSLELKELKRRLHPGLELLETGEGSANSERQLDAWLDRRTPRPVFNIGFAGALSPSLQAGDLVIAREVHDSEATPDSELLTLAGRVQIDAPVHFGTAVTSHEILWQ